MLHRTWVGLCAEQTYVLLLISFSGKQYQQIWYRKMYQCLFSFLLVPCHTSATDILSLGFLGRWSLPSTCWLHEIFDVQSFFLTNLGIFVGFGAISKKCYEVWSKTTIEITHRVLKLEFWIQVQRIKIYPSKWIENSNLKTLPVISIVVGSFRVGAPITNINKDPLFINRKGYHKN